MNRIRHQTIKRVFFWLRPPQAGHAPWEREVVAGPAPSRVSTLSRTAIHSHVLVVILQGDTYWYVAQQVDCYSAGMETGIRWAQSIPEKGVFFSVFSHVAESGRSWVPKIRWALTSSRTAAPYTKNISDINERIFPGGKVDISRLVQKVVECEKLLRFVRPNTWTNPLLSHVLVYISTCSPACLWVFCEDTVPGIYASVSMARYFVQPHTRNQPLLSLPPTHACI